MEVQFYIFSSNESNRKACEFLQLDTLKNITERQRLNKQLRDLEDSINRDIETVRKFISEVERESGTTPVEAKHESKMVLKPAQAPKPEAKLAQKPETEVKGKTGTKYETLQVVQFSELDGLDFCKLPANTIGLPEQLFVPTGKPKDDLARVQKITQLLIERIGKLDYKDKENLREVSVQYGKATQQLAETFFIIKSKNQERAMQIIWLIENCQHLLPVLGQQFSIGSDESIVQEANASYEVESNLGDADIESRYLSLMNCSTMDRDLVSLVARVMRDNKMFSFYELKTLLGLSDSVAAKVLIALTDDKELFDWVQVQHSEDMVKLTLKEHPILLLIAIMNTVNDRAVALAFVEDCPDQTGFVKFRDQLVVKHGDKFNVDRFERLFKLKISHQKELNTLLQSLNKTTSSLGGPIPWSEFKRLTEPGNKPDIKKITEVGKIIDYMLQNNDLDIVLKLLDAANAGEPMAETLKTKKLSESASRFYTYFRECSRPVYDLAVNYIGHSDFAIMTKALGLDSSDSPSGPGIDREKIQKGSEMKHDYISGDMTLESVFPDIDDLKVRMKADSERAGLLTLAKNDKKLIADIGKYVSYSNTASSLDTTVGQFPVSDYPEHVPEDIQFIINRLNKSPELLKYALSLAGTEAKIEVKGAPAPGTKYDKFADLGVDAPIATRFTGMTTAERQRFTEDLWSVVVSEQENTPAYMSLTTDEEREAHLIKHAKIAFEAMGL